MKYFCLIICFLYTILCASQTIVNPVFERTDHYELHVDKIEVNNDSTFVYCTLSMDDNSWANISPNTFIEDIATGKKYTIIRSEGIPFSPAVRNFNNAMGCKLIFVFPSINGAKKINLIENPDKESFNIYGISLTDSFEKSYRKADLELITTKTSFYETADDTINAIQYKKEETQAIQYFYGTDSYFVSLQELCAMFNKYGYYDETLRYMKDYNNSFKESCSVSIQMPLSATYIGFAYLNKKNEDNAIKWFEDAYEQFQLFDMREEYRVYWELITYITHLYNLQGKYSKALSYAIESCDVARNHFGEKTIEYVDALGLLSDCEYGLNKQDDALIHLESAVDIISLIPYITEELKQQYRDKLKLLYLRFNINKDVVVKDSVFSENAIILDATRSALQGDLQEVISKYSYLLKLYESKFPSVDLANYVLVVGSLSNALISAEHYNEADMILNNTLKLFQDNHINSSLIRHLYEAKGVLYSTIYNFDLALSWFKLSQAIYEENDCKDLQYAQLISNISVCYMQIQEREIAKELLEKAYKICIDNYGIIYEDESHRFMPLVLNNLATLYTSMHDFTKGKELYELAIGDATSQHNNNAKSLALVNLSEIYINEKNLHEAEQCLLEARKIATASYVRDMAELDFCVVQILQKKDNVIQDIQHYINRVKDDIAVLYEQFSEIEREDYWARTSQGMTLLCNLSAISFNTPQTLIMAFDNAIFTKCMLIRSERFLDELVKNCNAEIQEVYTTMKNIKKRISEKQNSNEIIESYRNKVSQYEKEIITAIPDLGNELKKQFKTFNNIKEMLVDNEVAVEFVFLPQVKPPFNESELLYGALLLTNNDSVPRLIPLCSEHDLAVLLESHNTSEQAIIDSLYCLSNNSLYQMIWEKIEPYIPNGSKVYYSPTGYINRIDLSAISNGVKRLTDIYDFYAVSTTALIAEVKQQEGIKFSNAVLYGDINYHEDKGMMAEKSSTFSSYSSRGYFATHSHSRGTWDLLPGTKEEIEHIYNAMKESGMSVQIFTQNNANEESFKAFSNNAPEIIHVATHGYYFPPFEKIPSSFFSGRGSYTKKGYSLLYSGLLFAGANNVWTGKKIADEVEDGILTADEISHLELSGNKLIVLSACNTGLGDIDKIDGVFGLQQGLKRAGVKTILMSLWKVPDEETQELMITFYKELLSGKTPHQSLRLAQKQLIEEGKSPFYWAGFVLLD